MTLEPPKKRIPSLDEIKADLAELAQNGEGAQRTQAYRLLLSMGTRDAVLPDPMNDDEREDRMARLMRGIGVISTRRAYLRAFPKRASVEHVMKQVGDTALDIGIPIDQWPKTLRQLYKRCPELKPRGGFPKGYPINDGLLAQQDWVRKMFYKYHVEKNRPDKEEALVELTISTEHADGIVARDDDGHEVRTGGPASTGQAPREI